MPIRKKIRDNRTKEEKAECNAYHKKRRAKRTKEEKAKYNADQKKRRENKTDKEKEERKAKMRERVREIRCKAKATTVTATAATTTTATATTTNQAGGGGGVEDYVDYDNIHHLGQGPRELPTGVAAKLKAWFLSPEHMKHPYPTQEEQTLLLQETGIGKKQLQTWFKNARCRIWKPLMLQKEKKEKEERRKRAILILPG